MKPLGTLTAAALLAATMLASPMAVRAEDLAVDPSSWNFGEVAVGTSVARYFDFTSIGSSDVSLYLLLVTPDEVSMPVCGVDVACDFAITSSPGVPRIMPPGDMDTVEVTFTPSAIGPAHAFFYVRSNDTYPPPGSIAYLPLMGVGVEPVPPAPVPAASPGALVAMALALTGAAAIALKRMAR